MDVRDLILNETPTINEPKPKRTRKAPAAPVWEVVMSDHCDCAIRRTTATTSRLLVLLMSQGQFYIKDEKTGNVETMNEHNLSQFLRGCDRINCPVPWLTGLDSSLKHARRLCAIIDDENLHWLARRELIVLEYTSDWRSFPTKRTLESERDKHDNPMLKQAQKVCAETIGEQRTQQLANEARANSILEEKVRNLVDPSRNRFNIKELECFFEHYGYDWVRAYIRSFLAAPFVGTELPRLSETQVFDVANYEPGRLIEYVLCESVRQGYGDTANGRDYYSGTNNFVRTWGDTLAMQRQVRPKVYDKYPDELDSMHRRLSFRCRLMRQRVDEDGFKAHSERLSKLGRHDDAYIIRPPFSKDDMIDEATQQANCLASYVKAYANDETDIYFMRSMNEPEKSLVTVEVRDGAIRQAYRACNRRPSDEEVKWLNEWAEENGIKPVDVEAQRPQAV